MTSKDQQHRYESMSKGQELVESMLPRRLHEGAFGSQDRLLPTCITSYRNLLHTALPFG